jgi:hypothetical protein
MEKQEMASLGLFRKSVEQLERVIDDVAWVTYWCLCVDGQHGFWRSSARNAA